VGNEMQSVMGSAYPGPGINLGPAIVFAYAAVQAAARQRLPHDRAQTSVMRHLSGALQAPERFPTPADLRVRHHNPGEDAP
jgi:hypothetical protein